MATRDSIRQREWDQQAPLEPLSCAHVWSGMDALQQSMCATCYAAACGHREMRPLAKRLISLCLTMGCDASCDGRQHQAHGDGLVHTPVPCAAAGCLRRNLCPHLQQRPGCLQFLSGMLCYDWGTLVHKLMTCSADVLRDATAGNAVRAQAVRTVSAERALAVRSDKRQ